jgi:hypothetical protein
VFVMGGVAERYRYESARLADKVPALLHELRGSSWRKLSTLMARRRLQRSAMYRWPLTTAPGPAPGPGPAAPASSDALAQHRPGHARHHPLAPPPAPGTTEAPTTGSAAPSGMPSTPAAASSPPPPPSPGSSPWIPGTVGPETDPASSNGGTPPVDGR